MNKVEPRTLKGFRDFLPKEARKRQYVADTLKRVFESYGFEPLETPALEYAEILAGKYGEEGDRLMYKFRDNGGRDVALRYDQTVPLARVVAQYGLAGPSQALPLPFKRYQIQNVWRAENTQKGRFREFLQCDIDVVGADSSLADSEIVSVIISGLTALGFQNFKVLINDRKVFAGIDSKAVLIVDKLKKIGEEGVRNELRNAGFDEGVLEQIKNTQPTENLGKILASQENTVFFDPTLARGLDYYTGLIIEVEIDGYDAGSVGGGGRYDELVGMFGDKQIPSVGFAFGFDRLIDAMEKLNLFPDIFSTSKVLLLNLRGFEQKAQEVANRLRSERINTEIYLDPSVERGKQFAYADKKNIPYTLTPNDRSTSMELGYKDKNTGEIVKENLNLDKVIERLK